METLHGRCLCGKIVFEIRSPLQASAHCHCSFCRRAHGAAFVTWVVCAESGFTVTAGAGNIRWFQSSEQSERGFCDICGSTMLFRSSLCPGEIHVTRANLDDKVDVPPKYHCFVEQQVDWIKVDDGLARLSSDSEELSHYKTIVPR